MTTLLESYSIGLLCKWIPDLRQFTVVVVFVFDLNKSNNVVHHYLWWCSNLILNIAFMSHTLIDTYLRGFVYEGKRAIFIRQYFLEPFFSIFDHSCILDCLKIVVSIGMDIGNLYHFLFNGMNISTDIPWICECTAPWWGSPTRDTLIDLCRYSTSSSSKHFWNENIEKY